jgi:phage-related protein
VREWLKSLPEVERHAIGVDLLRAQWRWPIGMPLCRPMGGGLWKYGPICLRDGRRAYYSGFHKEHLVALHGFIKKTRATPHEDLTLARMRKKELEQ